MTLLDELPEAWRPILADTLNSDAGRKLQQHLIDLLAEERRFFRQGTLGFRRFGV